MEKKSPNWTRILLVVVAIFSVLAISGGVYFLAFKPAGNTPESFFNNSQGNQTNQANSSASPDALPTPFQLPEAGDNNKDAWNTYRTDDYSIQYPPEWQIKYYPQFPTAVQLYLYNPDIKPSSPSGLLAPAQYVTVFTSTTKDTAVQYVNKIQVGCCVGPSGTASAAASFQKVSVVIGGRTGIAYLSPFNEADTWNIVLANGSKLVDIYSSIKDIYAATIANQIINTFVFLK